MQSAPSVTAGMASEAPAGPEAEGEARLRRLVDPAICSRPNEPSARYAPSLHMEQS